MIQVRDKDSLKYLQEQGSEKRKEDMQAVTQIDDQQLINRGHQKVQDVEGDNPVKWLLRVEGCRSSQANGVKDDPRRGSSPHRGHRGAPWDLKLSTAQDMRQQRNERRERDHV